MADNIHQSDAELWLADHNHKARRELMFVAIGYLVGGLTIAAAAFWFLNWLYAISGLILIGVAYLACGGFRTEPPLISAETSRPRLLGVPRMANLSWWGPELIQREMQWILTALMAPISLPREAWRLMQTRNRLAVMDEPLVASVLARIVERRGGVLLVDLCQELGLDEPVRLLDQLADVRGVVFLQNPDRVTLTEPVMNEIRDHDLVPV